MLKNSFEYLRKYNKGRPFFVAGHSQGALHGQRLVHEHISNQSIKELFISACKFIGLFSEDNKKWENYKKNKASISEEEINSKIGLRDKARADIELPRELTVNVNDASYRSLESLCGKGNIDLVYHARPHIH